MSPAAATMKEVTVAVENGKVTQTTADVPIPQPKPTEVLVRVVAVGLNPKDWKFANGLNQGDDIAGYVEAVGSDVRAFRPGDRVFAYHDMLEPHGGYAQYAIVEEEFTAHLPEKVSFEEAATIPLPALTAALGLYQELDLPLPWKPARQPTPLLVYGAGTTVATYALQFARLANIHPIIAVAGRSAPHVAATYLDASKGDAVVDYRAGPETTVAAIAAALRAAGQPPAALLHALDTIGSADSARIVDAVVDAERGAAAVTDMVVSKGPLAWRSIFVKAVHTDANGLAENTPLGTVGYREFGVAFWNFVARGLRAGWFAGHRHRVVPGGLDGIAGALDEMMAWSVSAFRYVVRIEDTPALKGERGKM
ncbi:hypothetical protein KEM52_000695 [Ascosphaera acerosa]|nr:hypothetical protein KEM52_000695 [Ascosphaera acerosa]